MPVAHGEHPAVLSPELQPAVLPRERTLAALREAIELCTRPARPGERGLSPRP